MRVVPAMLMALALLAGGCAEPRWASTKDVQQAVYRHDAPPSITMITMIRTETGTGGHSALLINGSQRVIFDPAGTWWHRTVPERNDVLYGIRPVMLDFYVDYHARSTYHIVMQEKRVSPEVAELALRRVQEYGAVPKMHCSRAVSSILRGIPGFESVGHHWHPHETMADFARIPGVRTRKVFDDDAADNTHLLGNQRLPGQS